jgi:hypothetical protein
LKNILIVTGTFPPLNSIGAGRPYNWAFYFSKFGANITVLTYKKTERDGSLTYIKDCSKFNLIEVKVIQNRFKLFHFIKKGWEKIKNKKFDILISTSNPWQTHYLAYLYKNKYKNIKWIADFRDLWSKNHYYIQKGLKHKIHYFIEKKIISKADILTTVSFPLKQELKQLHSIKTEVIYNGYEILQPIMRKVNNKLIISYLGTIYKQRQDSLLLLLLSIKELIKENLLFIEEIEVNIYGEKLSDIPKIVKNDNFYKKFVNIYSIVPREKSLEIQNKSDLLLLLEWNDANTKGILTGKLFEYIASGTPIISIGPDDTFSASQLIKNTNTGFVCGMDKEKIKQVILDIKNNKYIYKPNYEEIKKFSRENQSKILFNLIKDL